MGLIKIIVSAMATDNPVCITVCITMSDALIRVRNVSSAIATQPPVREVEIRNKGEPRENMYRDFATGVNRLEEKPKKLKNEKILKIFNN